MPYSRASLPIASLQGLGPKSADWLRSVGIATESDLRECGAVVAYLRVMQAGHQPGRNLLWALHGALEGKAWTAVSQREKSQLLAELAELQGN